MFDCGDRPPVVDITFAFDLKFTAFHAPFLQIFKPTAMKCDSHKLSFEKHVRRKATAGQK